MSKSLVRHECEAFVAGQAEYFRTDLRELSSVDIDLLEAVDRQMHELGLQALGDFVLSEAPGMAVRAFGADGFRSFGMHVQSVDGEPYTEFYSQFSDRSSLTTTTNALAESMPEFNIYRTVMPDAKVAELHAEHERTIDRQSSERATENLLANPSLTAAAQAIDDFLKRVAGVE